MGTDVIVDDWFGELRKREFGRLDEGSHVYLDYTGSGLYPESLVRRHAELLCGSVLGNPHSQNPTSLASTRRVEEAREAILAFFDADPAEYEVAFTLNASGALKLVAESYPFGTGSRLVLTADNHNSVHGIREFAAARGAAVRYVPLGDELRVADLEPHLAGADPERPNLFVYPAQSNFSGVQHPLAWIQTARRLGYDVFLDAAAFVPSNALSLRACAPDFVCVSFYKMLGFPTGVGALLARRGALDKLRRPWFGGGTVRFASAQPGVHLLHTMGRGFEDGTPNYLDIAAIPPGLNFLRDVGMERVHEHVAGLTGFLLRELGALRHANGAARVRLYGPRTTEARGGTVAFNVLTPEGAVVDCQRVEERTAEENISLRAGYFCNPGAAESAFGHGGADVRRCFDALSGRFSLPHFSVCMEDRPVGAVRVSLGLASNRADLLRLFEVLAGFGDGRVRVEPRIGSKSAENRLGTARRSTRTEKP